MTDPYPELKALLRGHRFMVDRKGCDPEAIRVPVELRAGLSRDSYQTAVSRLVRTYRGLRGAHAQLPALVALLTDDDSTIRDDADRPVKPFPPPFRWRGLRHAAREAAVRRQGRQHAGRQPLPPAGVPP